jgi:hypothetical protein
MSNVLKKITTRAKALKKKHPNAQWKTLVKQAGREYRTGTIPKKRKKVAKVGKVSGKRRYKVTHRVKKVGAVKRRKPAKKSVRPARSKPVTRVIRRTRTIMKVRKVGARSPINKLMPLLLLAGAGIIAYMILKPRTTTPANTLVLTGNSTRDNSAQNLLSYATAAGLGVDAILKIINALNNSSDSAVVTAAQSPDLSINTLLAQPTGGPSITFG